MYKPSITMPQPHNIISSQLCMPLNDKGPCFRLDPALIKSSPSSFFTSSLLPTQPVNEQVKPRHRHCQPPHLACTPAHQGHIGPRQRHHPNKSQTTAHPRSGWVVLREAMLRFMLRMEGELSRSLPTCTASESGAVRPASVKPWK